MTAVAHPASVAPAGALRAGAGLYALTLGSFFAASSAPTPLYHLYQQRFALAPVTLTVIFAVYAFALLLTLLTAGSLSDYLGRRPVIALALVGELIAMGLFLLAHDAGGLIIARILQGAATGIAASALGAGLLDTSPQHGPLINTLSPLTGMALGALIGALLVEQAPLPLHLVYLLLIALMVLELLGLAWVPETARRRPGVLRAMRPRIAVPPAARTMLLAVTPPNLAVWSVGGLSLSLVPSIVRQATGLESQLVGGAVVAVLTFAGCLAILVLRQRPPRQILIFSTSALIVGLGLFILSLNRGQVGVLFVGTAITGLGFGSGFMGTVRNLMPLARPEERAGLLSALYVESYLAFSLPAIGAGLLARQWGLIPTANLYAAMVIALAILGLITAMSRRD